MAYAIGVAIALATGIFGRVSGFDRERAFYATVLVVVGHYYVLFATMAADTHALLVEVIFFFAFAAVAVIGFKRNMLYVAIGLIAHGLFDFAVHPHVPNPGMPVWWPGFCAAFDVVMGAWMLLVRPRRA